MEGVRLLNFGINSAQDERETSLPDKELIWLAANYPIIFSILLKTEEIAKHSFRASQIGDAIAKEIGLDFNKRSILARGLITHDFGKLYWSPDIHVKPKLSNEDDVIKRFHPVAGYHYLIKHSYPEDAATVALKHHEYLDGSGYPNGVLAEQLTIIERIASVADCFEALTASRPYRKIAYSYSMAIQKILEADGKYDQDIAQCLKEIIKKRAAFFLEKDHY